MTLHRAKEIFSEHIAKKGLRHTRQREVILDAFFSAERHITADEVFAIVQKHNPEMGLATVHRNLKLLCECGLAEEIKIGNEKTRYEQNLGTRHHDHLICLKCGRFIEVNDEKIEKLQDKLAQANGFSPIRHKLEIYGYCKSCG